MYKWHKSRDSIILGEEEHQEKDWGRTRDFHGEKHEHSKNVL